GGAYQDARDARVDFARDFFTYGGSYSLTGNIEMQYSGAWSDLGRDFVNDSSIVDRAGNYDGSYTETDAEGTNWENEFTARFSGKRITAVAGIGNTRQTMNTRSYTFLRAFNYESETNLDSLDLTESINHLFLHTELNGTLIHPSLESFSVGLGSRLVSHNEFGTHLTYELNPKYQLSVSTLLYGAVTTGFNAPSLYQLNSPARSATAVTNRGNRSLDPEESISYEIGWKQTVGPSLRFNLSLFRTDVQDVIEYVYLWNGDKPADQLSSADFRGDTYLNASEQRIHGVEFGFDSRIGGYFTLGGNLTYTHSTLSFNPNSVNSGSIGNNRVQIYESGAFVTGERELESLTRRPSLSANLQASWQPSDPLRIKLSSRFVGERDDIFYSTELGPGYYGALGRTEVEGYNVTDLSVQYSLFRDLTLIGKIENLFDASYTEINGYHTKGRGFVIQADYRF
ncbi:MAG: TonB-dependent receptor, partial [Balneolaceae bacterium]|nr:TonB-dependent receptor [Balneolaceae bacterium]